MTLRGLEPAVLSFVERLSSNTSTFGLSFVGRFVLFRSVLYRRFHCTALQTTKWLYRIVLKKLPRHFVILAKSRVPISSDNSLVLKINYHKDTTSNHYLILLTQLSSPLFPTNAMCGLRPLSVTFLTISSQSSRSSKLA